MPDPGILFDKIRRTATEFVVTSEHLKLLRRAYIGWDDCEFGAPAIDAKRPYGDSNVLADMAEILGIDAEADRVRWNHINNSHLDEGEFSDPLEDHLTRLHAETGIVLQIGVTTEEFEPGRYVREQYGDWRRAGD